MAARDEHRDDCTLEPVLLRCPRCGMVSEGPRCDRCNAPKITQCSGSCTMCGLATCETPDKD